MTVQSTVKTFVSSLVFIVGTVTVVPAECSYAQTAVASDVKSIAASKAFEAIELNYSLIKSAEVFVSCTDKNFTVTETKTTISQPLAGKGKAIATISPAVTSTRQYLFQGKNYRCEIRSDGDDPDAWAVNDDKHFQISHRSKTLWIRSRADLTPDWQDIRCFGFSTPFFLTDYLRKIKLQSVLKSNDEDTLRLTFVDGKELLTVDFKKSQSYLPVKIAYTYQGQSAPTFVSTLEYQVAAESAWVLKRGVTKGFNVTVAPTKPVSETVCEVLSIQNVNRDIAESSFQLVAPEGFVINDAVSKTTHEAGGERTGLGLRVFIAIAVVLALFVLWSFRRRLYS